MDIPESPANMELQISQQFGMVDMIFSGKLCQVLKSIDFYKTISKYHIGGWLSGEIKMKY